MVLGWNERLEKLPNDLLMLREQGIPREAEDNRILVIIVKVGKSLQALHFFFFFDAFVNFVLF